MPLNSVHKLDCFFLISFPFACPALEIEEVSSGCTRVSVGTGVMWDCSDYSAWLSRAKLIILNLSAWLKKKKKKSLSHVRLFTTLWTVVCQAPLSMGFSRQEYWSGLPCPLPGDLPDWGTETLTHVSPVLAGGSFTTSATWGAHNIYITAGLPL